MYVPRTDLMTMVFRYTGSEKLISIPKLFVELTGDHVCALVLNEVIFLSETSKDTDGWFSKNANEWYEDLRITNYQLRRAVKVLEPFGIEKKLKKANAVPTLHFRVNSEKFLEAFFSFLKKKRQ